MGVIVEMKSPLESLEKKIKAHKLHALRNRILTVLLILAALVNTALLLELQTYGNTRSIRSYGMAGTDNNNYTVYSDGVLKYSRDGITYLNQYGKAQWDQSYQLKTPFVEVNDKAVAVADRGGNDILVFGEDGLKGEIHTNYPIEKITIAGNGIVCALLKNESSPEVVCYDAEGTVLVEHRSSLGSTGYPIGMALSPDGSMLQLSYLCVEDGVEATRVVYFNFGNFDKGGEECRVTEDIYKNTMIPESFFVNEKKSVLVGDRSFMIYSGSDKPVMTTTVELGKEIRNFFYDDKHMGFILQTSGESGYELRLYDMTGRQILSRFFDGEYNNVKLSKNSVILFDGKECRIYSIWGIEKFCGEFDSNILEIRQLTGVNKYLVISADGMEEVRLVK